MTIEFVDYIDSVKDVADEIKIQICKTVGKIVRNITEFFQFLGEMSTYAEHIKNDDDEKVKEEKDEKVKEDEDVKMKKIEKERQEEEIKKEKEINEEINKIESSAFRKKVLSLIAKYKNKICFAILLYTCFQNFLIAYMFAFCYSILIFMFYAMYQLLIEKLSKDKFNYYSLMWMFFFLNKQILLFPIWSKFFAYQSFMNVTYKFRGFTLIQLVYIIFQSIRMLINVIEIIYYVCKNVTKQISTHDIIAIIIFPF